MHRAGRALADLRGRRPRSTPLIRVCAVNGTKVACASSPASRSRRPYCGLGQHDDRAALRASRRPGRTAARRRPASSIGDAADRRRTPLACRLPSVMVPVLSSSSVFTSPAASTARPHMASTLRCTSRSMPAMPIADSSAPIVVGIRQTSSDTSTMPVTPLPSSAAVSGSRGWLRLGEDRQRLQRHDGQQEDDRQRRRAGCSARSRSGSSAGWRPRPARSSGR